jgi:hypothetical protein
VARNLILRAANEATQGKKKEKKHKEKDKKKKD